MERTNSTPSSSASQDTTKINLDGQGGQFAFLVHSQDSVSQNTPPDIDDQRLTRQRRRRTRYNQHNIRHEDCLFTNCLRSPEDHAVLEAEYKKNPKPDKAARVAIVSRVALGEKEVQVSAIEIGNF